MGFFGFGLGFELGPKKTGLRRLNYYYVINYQEIILNYFLPNDYTNRISKIFIKNKRERNSILQTLHKKGEKKFFNFSKK